MQLPTLAVASRRLQSGDLMFQHDFLALAAMSGFEHPLTRRRSMSDKTEAMFAEWTGQGQGPDVVRILHISDTHSLHRSPLA